MKDIEPFNQKGQPHGYWESYWSNGSRMIKCFYYNGKPVGYTEDYWNGDNELTNKTYDI